MAAKRHIGQTTSHVAALVFAACVVCVGTPMWADDTATIFVSVVCDPAPPAGTIMINNGDHWTTSIDVSLTVDASDPVTGVTLMRFSNDGVQWSLWEPYATDKQWSLTAGLDGTRDVYAQFADGAGNTNTDLSIYAEIRLDTTPPIVSLGLNDRTPSSLDRVTFAVDFSEDVVPVLTAQDISLAPGSLAGNIEVSGDNPNYTVAVTFSNSDADGSVGIEITGNGLTDAAGLPLEGAASPLYTIHNWHGLTLEPADAKRYSGDSQTFAVDGDFGPITPLFQWKWKTPANEIADGPTEPAWTFQNVTPENRGSYWCEVTYDGTEHESAHGSLSVEAPLRITVPLVDAEERVNGTHTFAVETSGGYAPLLYTWKKNSVPITDATQPSYTTPPLSFLDAGVYTVDITDANTASCSTSANLTVTWGMALFGLSGLAVLTAALALTGALARKSLSVVAKDK